MPQRSTPFQAIIHLVRQQLASPGVTVTESKMLLDSHSGMEREVDIVVEGDFDGDSMVVSIEVNEQARRAPVTWVEQLIRKHQYLPTNRLVLISQSGFTTNAKAVVSREGGWVEALHPELLYVDGETVVEKLYAERVSLTPTGAKIRLIHPEDHAPVDLDVTVPLGIFDEGGRELGTAEQLACEVLQIDWVTRRIMIAAHGHPDRDNLQSFACGIGLATQRYFLRREPQQTLHLIEGIGVEGNFTFEQEEMSFQSMILGNRAFAAGQGQLFGLSGVWVLTLDEKLNRQTLGWRVTETVPTVAPLERSFPKLDEIAEPDDLTVLSDAGGTGPPSSSN